MGKYCTVHVCIYLLYLLTYIHTYNTFGEGCVCVCRKGSIPVPVPVLKWSCSSTKGLLQLARIAILPGKDPTYGYLPAPEPRQVINPPAPTFSSAERNAIAACKQVTLRKAGSPPTTFHLINCRHCRQRKGWKNKNLQYLPTDSCTFLILQLWGSTWRRSCNLVRAHVQLPERKLDCSRLTARGSS